MTEQHKPKFKLYNTIVVWDVYTIAESNETAREAALALIQAGELPASESTAIEVRNEREVRDAWRTEAPIVAPDVSDTDFGHVKGKKTLDVFQMLHIKQPKSVEADK